MPGKIIVTYIFHSCYTVEIGDFFIIFDYFKGPLNIPKDKKVVFVASHGHADHYTSEILKLPDMASYTYLLSYDIAELEKEDNVIFVENQRLGIEDLKSVYKSKNVHIFRPYVTEEIQIKENVLSVKTFGSTDQGISFLLSLYGINIFHSGDLNFRDREDDDEKTQRHEYDIFMDQVEKIKNNQVDLAFFPVDYRLGKNFDKGGEIFIREVKPQLFFPMHSGGHEEIYRDFLKKHGNESSLVASIYKPGQKIQIEIDNSL